MASHNDIVQPPSAPATVPAAQLAFMKKPNGKTATDAPFGTSTANKPQQHPCLHASRLSRPSPLARCPTAWIRRARTRERTRTALLSERQYHGMGRPYSWQVGLVERSNGDGGYGSASALP